MAEKIANWRVYGRACYLGAAVALATPLQASEACSPDCSDVDDEHWVDASHGAVETGVEALVNWFDGFFVSDREEVETGNSFLRLRQALEWEDGEGWDTKTRLRARAQLPNLSDRISLAFSSDDDAGEIDLAENQLGQRLARDDDTLSVQYEALRTERSRLDFRYHWRSDLDPMVSGRFRRDFVFSDQWQARATQVFYWANDDGLGEETRVDLDYLLDPRRVVRWRNKAHYGEETDGLEWLSQLLLATQLSERSAITYYAGMVGETDPDKLVKRYSTGIRFRQNVFRPWLFYELEPAAIWKKAERGESRELVYALTLRLELFFGTRN